MDAQGNWLKAEIFDAQFGDLSACLAQSPQDLESVAALRADRFRGNPVASDLDRFDPLCAHLLVRAGQPEHPVGSARFRLLVGAEPVTSSYCAQFYDLSALGRSGMRLLEIGRICIAGGQRDHADIARALLAGLSRAAQAGSADMLIGCASFAGADPNRHVAALRYLNAHHVGPAILRPGKGRGETHDLAQTSGRARAQDLRDVPALLRMYLAMGGWVSDHAICDPDLDTLHVFTAVDVRAIPPARLRVLQMLARG